MLLDKLGMIKLKIVAQMAEQFTPAFMDQLLNDELFKLCMARLNAVQPLDEKQCRYKILMSLRMSRSTVISSDEWSKLIRSKDYSPERDDTDGAAKKQQQPGRELERKDVSA